MLINTTVRVVYSDQAQECSVGPWMPPVPFANTAARGVNLVPFLTNELQVVAHANISANHLSSDSMTLPVISGWVLRLLLIPVVQTCIAARVPDSGYADIPPG